MTVLLGNDSRLVWCSVYFVIRTKSSQERGTKLWLSEPSWHRCNQYAQFHYFLQMYQHHPTWEMRQREQQERESFTWGNVKEIALKRVYYQYFQFIDVWPIFLSIFKIYVDSAVACLWINWMWFWENDRQTFLSIRFCFISPVPSLCLLILP